MGIYCKIEKDNSCSLMKRFQKEPPCFSKVSRNPMGGDPCANHFGRMCDGQKTMEKNMLIQATFSQFLVESGGCV